MNEKSNFYKPSKSNNIKRKKKRGRGQQLLPTDDYMNSQKMNDYIRQINQHNDE